MIIAAIVISGLYSFLIIAFIIGFDQVNIFTKTVDAPLTKFSIVIPFRNEAENLPSLLESIQQLNYLTKLHEVILVDDDSNDDSVMIIEEFIKRSFGGTQGDFKIIKNIRKSNSPKKDAIEIAIKQANYDWIITTDADCILSENWLKTFDTYIQINNPRMIVAPVMYNIKNSLLEQFQLFDFLSLQTSTIGGFGIRKPFLCNGANLCYNKQSFFEVNGFDGNEQIASGDDIFLLEKFIKKYPNEVHFLKSNKAIVITKPQPSLQKLFSQRIRWAAKTTAYTNRFTLLVGTSVFLMNLLLAIAVFLIVFKLLSWQIVFLLFFIKLALDFLLLNKIVTFFRHPLDLKYYLVSSLLYPFFSMFVAIASLQTQFDWKGRYYKK